ncbi:MAG: ribonuclease III [Lachnospiraceae bacterium]|nr:ribonuclease III [Lachnospiraceae bacterium]
MSFEKLQERIGYRFRNESLLRLALTHSSYVNEHGLSHEDCNERIEYLGDAVLELASSDYLYLHYPHETEGEMTKIRASLVCEQALAEVAREIGIGEYMLMGRGEIASGGADRDSSISDALESVIGAIYLDSSFTNAKDFVYRFIMKDIETRHLFYDSKTILQETVQGEALGELRYELTGSSGPDHDRIFTSDVIVGGRVLGTGSGRSKKLSEQKAAFEALLRLKGR